MYYKQSQALNLWGPELCQAWEALEIQELKYQYIFIIMYEGNMKLMWMKALY
jgi:hypothetical protein